MTTTGTAAAGDHTAATVDPHATFPHPIWGDESDVVDLALD